MAEHVRDRATTGDQPQRANVALGLAGIALVLYVVAINVAEEENGWLWPLTGLLGAAAAITGWRAGKPKPRGRALAAVVIGGLLFISILAWTIVAAISGDL